MLIDSMKISYMTGKGNRHVVSLMIPDDTVPAMKILADPKIRREVGVSDTNYFVFASTQLSELNFSG